MPLKNWRADLFNVSVAISKPREVHLLEAEKVQKNKYNLSKSTPLPTIVLLSIWHLAEIFSSCHQKLFQCLNLAVRLTGGIPSQRQGGSGEFWAWKNQLQLCPHGNGSQVRDGEGDWAEQEQIVPGQAD